MSEKWDGFTTEEILNIGNPKVSQIQESSCLAKKATFKQNRFSRKNMTRERMLKTVDKHCQIDGEIQGLPKEANLFIPQIPEEEEEEEEGSNETSLPCQEVPFNGTSTPPVPYASLCEESDVNISPLEPYFSSKESGTECNINKKCSPLSSSSLLLTPNDKSLDEFEKRQNMIKEQNRQRKELLKKALEDRTKKTQEESRRLSQIEDELKKLDIQLSNDVSILRNQIELASLEFMETQKRFDHAEQEYLDAKLALFTKRERKELLTSHLCTIIEQNELRKAKKLSDLMDKLQLGSVLIEKPMERPDHKSSQESTEQTTVSNKIQKVNNATT